MFLRPLDVDGLDVGVALVLPEGVPVPDEGFAGLDGLLLVLTDTVGHVPVVPVAVGLETFKGLKRRRHGGQFRVKPHEQPAGVRVFADDQLEAVRVLGLASLEKFLCSSFQEENTVKGSSGATSGQPSV